MKQWRLQLLHIWLVWSTMPQWMKRSRLLTTLILHEASSGSPPDVKHLSSSCCSSSGGTHHHPCTKKLEELDNTSSEVSLAVAGRLISSTPWGSFIVGSYTNHQEKHSANNPIYG